jgi:hypothetical protein
MGVLNRLIMIVLAIGLIALGGWFILAPIAALAGADTVLSVIRNNLQTSLVIAGIVAFVGLILFLAQLMPSGRRSFVASVPEGTIEYSRRSVEDMLERDLVDFDGVEDARVQVRGRGRKVDSRVRLRTDGTTDSRDLASRVGGRVRDRLDRLNLGLGALNIVIDEPNGIRARRRVVTAEPTPIVDEPPRTRTEAA